MSNQEVSTKSNSYEVDQAHSLVGFSVRHAMVAKVHGSFSKFSGGGVIDLDSPEKSLVHLEIEASSIYTANADRDAHLRSNDFFDMEAFPVITFDSTKVEKISDSTFDVTGDLTMRGVTNPVTIRFEHNGTAVDVYSNTRVGFEGATTINRKDWGINWNAALEAGGVLLSEKVVLELEISAVLKTAQ